MRQPKPHRTNISAGYPVVEEIADPAVKELILLMNRFKGSKIHRFKKTSRGKLIIPGQPPMDIKRKYFKSILEWCDATKNDIGEHMTEYELHEEAIKTLAIYSL